MRFPSLKRLTVVVITLEDLHAMAMAMVMAMVKGGWILA